MLDSTDPALWTSVACSLASFAILMGLSYFWFYRDVVTVTHHELTRYFGPGYHRRCCPAPLVYLVSVCSRDGSSTQKPQPAASSSRA